MNQKLTLEFNMEDPLAREAYQECLNAGLYAQLLIAVQEEIFRPARKHGYMGMNSGKLNRLLEIPEVAEAIELLEELYYRQKDTYLNTSTF
jgi:predicted ester cyclase